MWKLACFHVFQNQKNKTGCPFQERLWKHLVLHCTSLTVKLVLVAQKDKKQPFLLLAPSDLRAQVETSYSWVHGPP